MVRSAESLTASDNPFSAHRIRPGSIPYLFSAEDDATDVSRLDQLIDSWRAGHYFGQIVGPHGCGKTTLAYAIARRAVEDSRIPFNNATSLTIRSKPLGRSDSSLSWLTGLLGLRSASVGFGKSLVLEGLLDRQNEIPSTTHARLASGTILVIDGIERLTLMQQALTFHSLRRRQIPTLFTTHRVSKSLTVVRGKCPVLFRASPDVNVFAKIVNLMTQPEHGLAPAAVEDAFDSCGGNVREALMKLYDSFDSREVC